MESEVKNEEDIAVDLRLIMESNAELEKWLEVLTDQLIELDNKIKKLAVEVSRLKRAQKASVPA